MFGLMTTNWKTTVAGVLAFVAALATQAQAFLDSKPETIADWDLVVVAFIAMVGLLRARDDNKSSEDQVRVKSRSRFES